MLDAARDAALAQVFVRYRGLLVDVAHLDGPRARYSVGASPRASFALDLDEGAVGEHRLLECVGGAWIVDVPRGFEGARAGRAELHPGTKVVLRSTEIEFELALVSREAAAGQRATVDLPLWVSLAIHGVLGVAFLLLLALVQPDPTLAQLEQEQVSTRMATALELSPPQLDFVEIVRASPRDLRVGGEQSVARFDRRRTLDGGEASAAHAGQAGRRARGRRQRRKPVSGPGEPQAHRHPKRGYVVAANPTAAQRDGLLSMARESGSFLSSTSYDVRVDDRGLWATQGFVPDTVAGLALRGRGRGGGGASSLEGFGDPTRRGRGLGVYGEGRGNATNFGDRKGTIPDGILCKLRVQGTIDRELVRRVVRSHQNEIRSCYNAALTRDPNAGGRVSVHFSILGTGKVGSASIEESSIDDAAFEACVTRSVLRWRFPVPPGGGTVLVNYPFELRRR